MSNLIQASELIKKVVISLHKVTEGLIGADLIEYKEFYEFYRQFSNPNNEWKYIFKLPNIKLLSDIYASLKLLEISKNEELLEDNK